MLSRIHKGFFSLKSQEEINPYLLCLKALLRYGYISCETVLFNKDIIFQPPSKITLISDIAREFSINRIICKSRKLKNKYLFNPLGITELKKGLFVATVERAITDILYFNPTFHFDNRDAIN